MFRKFLASTVALVAVTGTAFAADLPSRAPPPVYVPPPPVFTWTGFYIGGQIGYEWGTETNNTFITATGAPFSSSSFTDTGFVGGGHIGYNWQNWGQFVLGIEADVNGADFQATTPFFFGLGTRTVREDIDGSVRGRIGWAWDRVLFYGTGGVAFGDFQHTFALGPFVDQTNNVEVGWTVGGGIEYAIDNNWSVRAEYRFTEFFNQHTPLINTTADVFTVQTTDFDNRVQVGFSYKFLPPPPPPPPVVAKY